MKKAVIDLGTNTCNLLIAEKKEDSFAIIYSGKEAVKLGKGGITQGNLTEEAMDRGFLALTNHKKRIEEHGVDSVIAFGTSAMRGAQNRDLFIQQVSEKLQIPIEVIDGEREAELIFKGVRHAVKQQEDPFLILDIGGGSNEFIIGQGDKIIWKHSFNIGMARALDRFCPSDPMISSEIEAMEAWYTSELSMLWDITNQIPITTLVGCSGAFDTFLDLIQEVGPGTRQQESSKITIQEFIQIHSMLISSTAFERSSMRGMDSMRIEMIVLASVFVNFIIRKLGIREIVQSNFSLKEGAMSELLCLQ